MGRHKYIETPEKLLEFWDAYVFYIKSNPILVHEFVGKDGNSVEKRHERPLTQQRFEAWMFRENKITVGQYFDNKDKAYNDFVAICSHIKVERQADQIEGGMAGIYNPSITQRLNGLVDKTQNENDNNNILSGKLSVNVISTGVPLSNSEKEVNDTL